MKFVSTFLFSGVVALGAAGAAYAQGAPPGAGAREAMEKACAGDIASLCAGKAGREAAECLRAAADKVSPICRDALAQGGGRGGPPGAQGAARPPRAPPSEGGTLGIVDSVSPGSIEIAMSSGQKATVVRSSHTAYGRGASSALGSSIKPGDTVLVLGVVMDIQGEHKTSIDANQVTAQPVGMAFTPAAPGAVAAGPQPGGRAAEKRVGQIPPNYVEGEGTIIVDTAVANRAIVVALTNYPNGIINRVVKLSDGTYECHHVGVGWPHHVFVTSDFKYIGAF